jgi:hypothetical protein
MHVRMRFSPERGRNRQWIDPQALPPGSLVSSAVQFAMMKAADGNGVFVADFAARGGRLRKFDVMGITGRSAAYEAGLLRDKSEVCPISFAHRFGKGD